MRIAYNIMDLDQPVTNELLDVISNLEGVIQSGVYDRCEIPHMEPERSD